jgi:hypothetical protein
MYDDGFEDNMHQLTCSKILICSWSLMVSSDSFWFCGATATLLSGTSGGLCSSWRPWWSSIIFVPSGWAGPLFLWSRGFDREFGWNILEQICVAVNTLQLRTAGNKQFQVIRGYDERSSYINVNMQMQVETFHLPAQSASRVFCSVHCENYLPGRVKQSIPRPSWPIISIGWCN